MRPYPGQTRATARRRPMRFTRVLALGASALVLLSACSTGGGSKPTVKVGSDGFYEAKLMAEIYAQALEAGGYTVDRTGIGIGAGSIDRIAAGLEGLRIDLGHELGFVEAVRSDLDGRLAAPTRRAGAEKHQCRRPE